MRIAWFSSPSISPPVTAVGRYIAHRHFALAQREDSL